MILSQIYIIHQRTTHSMKRERSVISGQEIFEQVAVKERGTVELMWTSSNSGRRLANPNSAFVTGTDNLFDKES